jgi:hypothetical protein
MGIFFLHSLQRKESDPELDLDTGPVTLVRGMDPRIRIHTIMSWIRKTAKQGDKVPLFTCSSTPHSMGPRPP